MNPNSEILATLIDEDFGLEYREGSNYARAGQHDSLILDFEKGLFFWNSKGLVGDPLVYLLKVRKLSFPDARKFLARFNQYTDTFAIKHDEDVVVYPRLVDIFWESGLNNRDYWYDRCLTDETVNRFKLGYFDGWYLIPLFENGTLKNFQCRRDKPIKRIKSWYRGLKPLVFNTDILKVVDRIYITEGPVDAILLNQNNINAVSHNGGAEGWSQAWFKYFFKQKEIIYVGDNDKPGLAGAKKVAKSLGVSKVKIFTFNDFDYKYDTVDYFRDGGLEMVVQLVILLRW